MTNDNNLEQFKDAINKALNEFERRLEQQRLFQLQNELLKSLQLEIKKVDFCGSDSVQILSEQYLSFRTQLNETGRSYEHIVAEKNLVDTCSAFEKFLFDCFYSVYDHFPKFLGNTINVNTVDLFLDNNILICKKNVIELTVKGIIQTNSIKETISNLKKKFDMKATYDENELWLLYEILLVRNLVIHNNSIVNRVYKESIKKMRLEPIYDFIEGETVFNHLNSVVDDMKSLSSKLSKQIANNIVNDSRRLHESHENTN
jgi:hypothetical protein